jgi:hypothetical protein
MSRAARVLIVSLGIGVAALGPIRTASAGATAPPAPPTTTVAPSPTTSMAVVVGTRGSAAAGSIAKPTTEAWSVERIAGLTALAVIALSAAGYAYGRLRSAPPRHPDLVRHPDDVDGIDHPQVGAAG